MAKITDISDFPSLNAVELGACIGLLVEYNCKIDFVKERMLKIYDVKVSGQTIKRILHQHDAEIKKKIQAMREDLKACHFYHLPSRLRELERVYYESMKERVINSCKTGEDAYELIEKPDIPSAISALKGMAADVHAYEKLEIERQKLGEGDEDDDDGEGGLIAGGSMSMAG